MNTNAHECPELFSKLQDFIRPWYGLHRLKATQRLGNRQLTAVLNLCVLLSFLYAPGMKIYGTSKVGGRVLGVLMVPWVLAPVPMYHDMDLFSIAAWLSIPLAVVIAYAGRALIATN